jgi:hypothetical protein
MIELIEPYIGKKVTLTNGRPGIIAAMRDDSRWLVWMGDDEEITVDDQEIIREQSCAYFSNPASWVDPEIMARYKAYTREEMTMEDTRIDLSLVCNNCGETLRLDRDGLYHDTRGNELCEHSSFYNRMVATPVTAKRYTVIMNDGFPGQGNEPERPQNHNQASSIEDSQNPEPSRT